MNKGIISKDGEMYCASCQLKVSKEGELKYHFCPKCGNPLDMTSMAAAEKLVNHEVLVALYDIKNLIDDGEDAKVVIEKYIAELKK